MLDASPVFLHTYWSLCFWFLALPFLNITLVYMWTTIGISGKHKFYEDDMWGIYVCTYMTYNFNTVYIPGHNFIHFTMFIMNTVTLFSRSLTYFPTASDEWIHSKSLVIELRFNMGMIPAINAPQTLLSVTRTSNCSPLQHVTIANHNHYNYESQLPPNQILSSTIYLCTKDEST